MFNDMDKTLDEFLSDTDKVLKKVRKQVRDSAYRRYNMNNNFYETPTEAGKSREFYKKLVSIHHEQVSAYIKANHDIDDFAVRLYNDVYLDEKNGEVYHCVRTAIRSFEGWNREFITKFDDKGTPLFFNIGVI